MAGSEERHQGPWRGSGGGAHGRLCCRGLSSPTADLTAPRGLASAPGGCCCLIRLDCASPARAPRPALLWQTCPGTAPGLPPRQEAWGLLGTLAGAGAGLLGCVAKGPWWSSRLGGAAAGEPGARAAAKGRPGGEVGLWRAVWARRGLGGQAGDAWHPLCARGTCRTPGNSWGSREGDGQAWDGGPGCRALGGSRSRVCC